MAAAISTARRQQLLEHDSQSIRQRAEAVMGGLSSKSRQQVIERYRAGLDLQNLDGERERGRQVFAQVCAACHRLEGVGQPIGPDLTELTDRSPGGLLVSILDPNRAVDPKHVSYSVALKDGRSLLGVIRDETANSVTLVPLSGEARTLLRSEIESVRSTGASLMPIGLEAAIPPAKMADLLAYLGDLGPEPRQIAGNEPRTIKPTTDSSYRLPASRAEIYGEGITFERSSDTITGWTGTDSYLTWRLDVPRPGRYSVELVWAAAGDPGDEAPRATVASGGSDFTIRVPPTGGADEYRTAYFAHIQLDEGRQSVTLRPSGAFEGNLMNFKALHLEWAPDYPRRPSNPEEEVR